MEGRLSGILPACEKGTSDPLPSTSTLFFSPPITEARPGVSPRTGTESNDNESFQNKPPTFRLPKFQPGVLAVAVPEKQQPRLIKYLRYGHLLGSEEMGVCVRGQVEVGRKKNGNF